MICPTTFSENVTSSGNGTSFFCPSFADNVTCWPTTPAGSLAVVPCPTYFEDLLLYPGNVTRLCTEKGTWQDKSNYSQCLNVQTNNFHSSVQRIMYYVGFSISVVALSIALFLFLYFRCLRCLRNTIHCHLITTFILRHVLWLKMPFLILQATNLHQSLCKLVITLFNYILLTNFFWMLIEGFYLFAVLVWAFSHERLRFWHFAIFGWGVPAIFIFAWVIVKATTASDSTVCWLSDESNKFDYIYIVPIFVVLLVNLGFLTSILWILVTKLRASNSSQNCLYKKAARATLILFPLLGMTYLFFVWFPQKSQLVFLAYLNVILQSTQGFFVAIFYCFLNVEVQNAVKNYLSRWKDDRKLSLRTQTSIIIQAEQLSLHGKDEVHPKARGALRKVESSDLKMDSSTLPASNDRGYINGLHKERQEKILLKSKRLEEEEEEEEECKHEYKNQDRRNDSCQYHETSADKETAPYSSEVNDEDDDEQDITKEDLV